MSSGLAPEDISEARKLKQTVAALQHEVETLRQILAQAEERHEMAVFTAQSVTREAMLCRERFAAQLEDLSERNSRMELGQARATTQNFAWPMARIKERA